MWLLLLYIVGLIWVMSWLDFGGKKIIQYFTEPFDDIYGDK